jgi:hypothetical protein
MSDIKSVILSIIEDVGVSKTARMMGLKEANLHGSMNKWRSGAEMRTGMIDRVCDALGLRAAFIPESSKIVILRPGEMIVTRREVSYGNADSEEIQ